MKEVYPLRIHCQRYFAGTWVPPTKSDACVLRSVCMLFPLSIIKLQLAIFCCDTRDSNLGLLTPLLRRYCYRQAEMGIGDCGGLRYIPGMTKSGKQKTPEWLQKVLGVDGKIPKVEGEGKTIEELLGPDFTK